jgi:hypothetical protein
MSCRIQFSILEFDEEGFSWESQASSLILRILGFASLRIIGFTLLRHRWGILPSPSLMLGYFSKKIIWLKTRAGSDGWQWVLT